MYRTLFALLTLTVFTTHPMDQFKDRFKDKLHNAADRLTARFNKEAVTNMVSNLGSFLNKGMSRLVNATIYNNNYTTKEKITVCGGAAVFLGLMATSKHLKEKAGKRKLRLTNSSSYDYLSASSRSLTKEEVEANYHNLSEKLDMQYTLVGVLNNLSTNTITNFDDFLISLNQLYRELAIFLPSHQQKNTEFIDKCKAQFDKEVKKIVNLVDKNSNNYRDTVAHVLSAMRLKQVKNSQVRKKYKEQLDEMEFAVKHEPVIQTNQA